MSVSGDEESFKGPYGTQKTQETQEAALNDTNASNSDVEDSPSCGTKWSVLIQSVFHKPILRALVSISRVSASNPKRTVVGVILLSIAMVVIGLYTNFNVDVNDDTIWSPVGSRPLLHMDWINNDSGFPKQPRWMYINLHRNGANVVDTEENTRQSIKDLFETIDAIEATEDFDDICPFGCYIASVSNFWRKPDDVNDLSHEQMLRVITDSKNVDGTPVDIENVVGNPKYDADGILNYAQMFQIVIPFPNKDETFDFEEKMLDNLFTLRDTYAANPSGNQLELFAERSFSDEFTRAIVTDIPLVPGVFIVMSIFTCLVFFKNDRVKSRTLLGFGAVVCVLLSIMTGYGLLFLCGVPFTSMTQILPFIMFGIGLDDAFIITGSFYRTDSTKPIVERVEETIEDVGLSITLTTVTSSLAFALGGTSSIPTVYWLCWYAFPTILVDFFYQLTFFVALLAIDEQRVLDNRRDCCVCCTAPRNDDNDQQQQADNNNGNSTGNNRQSAEEGQSDESSGMDNIKGADNDTSNTGESMVDRFMVWYAGLLLKPIVKAVVLLAFTALLGCCAFSASQLTQEFSFTDVLPEDSYVADFWDVYSNYVDRGSLSVRAYFRFENQGDPNIQDQMEQYVQDLVASEQFDGTEPPFFWLRDFRSFIANHTETRTMSFNQQVGYFLSDHVYYNLHANDIVRNPSTGEIVASRVLLYMSNVDQDDVRENIEALKDQRAVTARQPVNQGKSDWSFFTYDSIYNIWAFYAVAVEELIFSTVLGVVAVSGIALIGIPHWSATIFIAPLIIILYIDLLGVLQFAGVHVNAVSYVSLVMSIGLMVDFIMHVLMRYYEITGTREHKITEMLRTMGSSVLIGGISTFLGVIPLAFSTSQIFSTIFFTFLGLVTLGVGHGLILLPVVLSMAGPIEPIADMNHFEGISLW